MALLSLASKIIDEPVRALPLACALVYCWQLFLAEGQLLPGPSALALDGATWVEVRDLSLNFWFVGPSVFGGAFPVDERAFRRLGALAAVLANALRHNAALHPDKNLLASTHARNVLDGDLLFRYVALDHQLQVDLAKAVGTTKDTILDTLLAVDDLANFL